MPGRWLGGTGRVWIGDRLQFEALSNAFDGTGLTASQAFAKAVIVYITIQLNYPGVIAMFLNFRRVPATADYLSDL